MARSLRGLVASLLPVAVVVAAILIPLNAGGQEQSTFSAEEATVDKRIDLPSAAIQTIRRSVNATSAEINAGDLLASAIRLDGHDEIDHRVSPNLRVEMTAIGRMRRVS